MGNAASSTLLPPQIPSASPEKKNKRLKMRKEGVESSDTDNITLFESDDGVKVLQVGSRKYRVCSDDSLVPSESYTEKLYAHAMKKNSKKTAAEEAIILRGIESNTLLKHLDPEQKENLINACALITFKRGEDILRQGEAGDNWYVVEAGECDVYYNEPKTGRSIMLYSKGVGSSFGEKAMLLERPRSATVIARTDVRTWVIDQENFQEKVLPSKRLEKIFNKYATIEKNSKAIGDQEKEKYMNANNFFESITPNSKDKGKQICLDKIGYLFRLANRDSTGLLSFKDYALFNLIMSKSDAEYDIAFLMFDKDKKGFVTLSDLQHVINHKNTAQPMQQNSSDLSTFSFNFDCNLIQRFFGVKGDRILRYSDFSHFFISLQEEITCQVFNFLDVQRNGFITMNEFVRFLEHSEGWRMPPSLVNRIKEINSLEDKAKSISYAEFLAFHNFINLLPTVENILKKSLFLNDGSINRDNFSDTARDLSGFSLSPLTTDIVFQLFDIDHDGIITDADYKDIEAMLVIRSAFSENEGDASKVKGEGKEEEEDSIEMFFNSILNKISEVIEHFAIGSIAGGIGAFAVYPIDLVKTRMQNQRTTKGAVILYRNSLDCFKKILYNEGFLGMYRGLGPQLIGVAPEKAIKLTVNDLLRSAFYDPEKGRVYLPLEILSGAGAGASQVVFTNPLEIVKIRMQLQGELAMTKPGGAAVNSQSAMAIVRELGFTGLYKGASACFMRDVPFSAIYFPTYAAAKRELSKNDSELKPHHLLLAGAMAGAPSAALTTPADVIKTRLQVKPVEGGPVYKGIGDCAMKIFQTEGPTAFFKGAAMRVFRSSPQFGVTLLTYELLHRIVSPDSMARPPTNAPVSQNDFDSFRRSHIAGRLNRLHGLMKIQ